jgi:hypothetical protein
LPFVAWPQPGQEATIGAAAAWPVICAPHISQKGASGRTAEPQLGQLDGTLVEVGCAFAAARGVPQCMQNGELPFTSPPQCEQRDTPGAEELPAGAEAYCV